MTATDLQLQTLAIAECSTTEYADGIAALVPTWWAMYDDKDQLIQYWYLRRAICDYMAAALRRRVDYNVGQDKTTVHQQFENAIAMRGEADAELLRLYEGVGILGSVTPRPGRHTPDVLAEELSRIQTGLVPLADVLTQEGL